MDAWDAKGSCPAHVSQYDDPLELIQHGLAELTSQQVKIVVEYLLASSRSISDSNIIVRQTLVQRCSACLMFLSEISVKIVSYVPE